MQNFYRNLPETTQTTAAAERKRQECWWNTANLVEMPPRPRNTDDEWWSDEPNQNPPKRPAYINK